MSNEITLAVNLRCVNGAFQFEQNKTMSIDQEANKSGGGPGKVTIGTAGSGEVIPQTDVGTAGIMVIQNLDTTNYIVWGPESGGAIVDTGKIKPGELYVARLLPGMVLRARADTAACDAYIAILDN